MVTEEHAKFLTDLRDSEQINMFGAGPRLMAEFPDVTRQQAKVIILEWMSDVSKAARSC